jgi:phosphate:Na+ symporter
MNLWIFLAGLGFFIYGMNQLENILKNVSGRSFKLFLKKKTKNLLKTIIGSAIITGIVQSSSVVSLITLAFVEAGIISFRNALGVVLGSNLGTTLDSWIVATVGFKFDLLNYSYPLIAISSVGMFVFESRKNIRNIFSLLFSLALLFLGLSYMKEGALDLVKDFNISDYNNLGSFAFVIIGFLLTTIIQSSSATIAIALTAIYANALDLNSAAAIVIGSEVGTTIKIVLWGFKGSAEKKRVAWANFIYNFITATIAFIFLDQLIFLITKFGCFKDPLIGLVLFQSSINLFSILLFFPFINLFSNWLEKTITTGNKNLSSYASENLPILPILAIDAFKNESENLFQKVLMFTKTVLCSTENETAEWLVKIKTLTLKTSSCEKEYLRLKKTEGDLIHYYTQIQETEQNSEIATFYVQYLNLIRQSIFAAKAIIDIEHNLREFETSINDVIHIQIKEISEEWNKFESQIQNIYATNNSTEDSVDLNVIMHEIIANDENLKLKVIRQLKRNLLSEIEASTIMNVHRELLSSKKSILNALELILSNRNLTSK